jgi:hypothetical protein
MSDLKIGENFVDKCYITTTATGTASIGLTPTCTIIAADDTRLSGVVSEVGFGWYKLLNFTPTTVGTWCIEWGGFRLFYTQFILL